MVIGGYQLKETFLHRLDPRSKFFLALLLMVACFLHFKLTWIALIVGYLLVVSRIAQLPFSHLFKITIPLLFLGGFSFVYHLFTHPDEGTQLVSFALPYLESTIQVTDAGLAIGSTYLLRVIALGWLGLFFTYTTSPTDVSDSLETLLKPLKKLGLPTDVFALMFSLSLRFIPLVQREVLQIIEIQTLRGVPFHSRNPFTRVAAYSGLLVPILVRIFHLSDQISLALKARHYHLDRPRTRYQPLLWKISDSLCLALHLVLISLLAYGWTYVSSILW